MDKKYILISFALSNLLDYKFKKVGKTYPTFDSAVDAMVKDIAKFNKCTIEEWEEDMGGREEIIENGGEYMCTITNKAKYWKIIEI